MLLNNTYTIGYIFKVTECEEDGAQTVVYFDPDNDIAGITINILDKCGKFIKELENAITKTGEETGKGYKIKYKPESVDEAKLEILFEKDGEEQRDLLEFEITNNGENLTECQSDNFFFIS